MGIEFLKFPLMAALLFVVLVVLKSPMPFWAIYILVSLGMAWMIYDAWFVPYTGTRDPQFSVTGFERFVTGMLAIPWIGAGAMQIGRGIARQRFPELKYRWIVLIGTAFVVAAEIVFFANA